MTLSEIGQGTGGQDYAAVHDMIKRFVNKAKKDRQLALRMRELKGVILNLET